MNEIVEVSQDNISVPALGDETLVQLAEQAEKRVDAINKIKRAALKATNASDWTDQGGKPYLWASGAEKIGRVFGVSWKISEPKFEQEESGHFSYTYTGIFSVAGATIEAVGTRSSRDGFFKKYSYQLDGSKTELPVSEIDKGDVKKAAFTNLIGGGICRLLGIRNLTYEDLKDAGITKDQIGRVEYKEKGKKKEEIYKEEAQAVECLVSDVLKRTGKNDKGKPWTKYVLKCNGDEYQTFSESIAKVGKDAMTAKKKVKIVYMMTKFGAEIESVLVIEPEAASIAATDVREPGDES